MGQTIATILKMYMGEKTMQKVSFPDKTIKKENRLKQQDTVSW
jgi:hypothetical protein